VLIAQRAPPSHERLFAQRKGGAELALADQQAGESASEVSNHELA